MRTHIDTSPLHSPAGHNKDREYIHTHTHTYTHTHTHTHTHIHTHNHTYNHIQTHTHTHTITHTITHTHTHTHTHRMNNTGATTSNLHVIQVKPKHLQEKTTQHPHNYSHLLSVFGLLLAASPPTSSTSRSCSTLTALSGRWA